MTPSLKGTNSKGGEAIKREVGGGVTGKAGATFRIKRN